MLRQCEQPFEKTLHYASPAHGGWGIVRVGMLVPESHQLFVCPFACGRHGAIGAIAQGHKSRLSYLLIDETDIVSGSYEDLILDAVDQLFRVLPKTPKLLFIGVSCLDDLLGTDHDALLARLRARHPAQFQILHMNPISLGSQSPPPVTIQCKIYGLLEPSGSTKEHVNMLGNFIPVDRNCELYAALAELGIERIRHIAEADSYEDFLSMADSRYNLVLRPEGLAAAKEMQARQQKKYCFVPVSYDLDEVDLQYRMIMEMIKPGASVDLSLWRESAVQTIERVQNIIGNVPISIDSSAVCRPFNLARALISYGFNVVSIYTDEIPAMEESSWQWLRYHASHLRLHQAQHHSMVNKAGNCDNSVIAVGYNAGYMSGARSVANLVYDETMFGYEGIKKLMWKIEQAYKEPGDLEQMIRSYGLVV